MPRFIIFSIIVLSLAACSPPVSSTKNLDGSQTVSVNSPDGSATATTSADGTKSSYKDDKGNEYNVDTKTGKTEIKTDGGTTTMQTGTKLPYEKFGLKEYPGADAKDSKSNSITDSPEGEALTAQFSTSDAPTTVIDFYRPMVTENKVEANSDGHYMLSGKTSKGATIYLSTSVVDGETQVTLAATIDKKK